MMVFSLVLTVNLNYHVYCENHIFQIYPSFSLYSHWQKSLDECRISYLFQTENPINEEKLKFHPMF